MGILSGVMRDTIFEIAKDQNIQIKEKHIRLDEMHTMDEAFITSTGIGLLPCYWDDWNSDFKKTKIIKKELFKRIKIN